MTAITIGTPVVHSDAANYRCGHIVAISDDTGGGFIIGGAGLVPVSERFEIVFHDEGQPTSRTKVSDGIAAPWIARAMQSQMSRISEAEAADLLRRAVAMDADRQAKREIDRGEAERIRAEFVADAAGRIPADAVAVIVAELEQDESDSMSDYFNARTTRRIILGFSRHKRDLFPELRKAALNHPETAHLATAPEDAEHREKYSMGGGFYLKAGFRYSNGWKVSKSTLYNGAEGVPTGEWSTEPPPIVAPAASSSKAIAGAGFTIEQHQHTKRGFDIFVVIMAERVDRDRFEELRDAAKARGGWYSRAWAKVPAGFAFETRPAAEAFAADQLGTGAAPELPARSVQAPAVKAAPAGLPDKLRGFADGLQSAIDDKFRDRRSNTPKQQREAQSARLDGYLFQRAQKALYMLADHHDAGTVPADLAHVRTKAEVLDLAKAEIKSSGGYYDAGHETGQPYHATPAARALWAMIAAEAPDNRAAEALRVKTDALRFAKIPGFFPTQPEIVARMIEAARLPAGPFVMLEPGAGTAAILDAVAEEAPAAEFVIYERHLTLREILTGKGYALAGDDFTESDTGRKVQRVLMNPPFEKGQDMAHVRRAFDHLEDGGRLVSIMSPGPFTREDRASREFRAWFDELGGEKVDLPAGAFKASGTGVSSVMVIIDRDDPAPAAEILDDQPAQDPASDPAADPTPCAADHFIAGATLLWTVNGREFQAVYKPSPAPHISVRATDRQPFEIAGKSRRKYEPIMGEAEARAFYLNTVADCDARARRDWGPDAVPDMRDVKAHETAKRALEIAAVGGLSIYIQAEGGQGKSMLIAATKPLGEFRATEDRLAPLEDDHDLYVDLCPVSAADQILPYPAETTAMVAARVQMAKAALTQLCPGFGTLPLFKVAAEVEKLLQEPARRLMAQAVEAMQLSPDATAKVYRKALVICALAGSFEVGRVHIAEALSYRARLRRPRREKSYPERALIRQAWTMRAKLRAKTPQPPAPAPRGPQRSPVEADERAHLEGEIDQLRATVAVQAARIDRLTASRGRVAGRFRFMRGALKREAGINKQLLANVTAITPAPRQPSPIILPSVLSSPRGSIHASN